MVVLELPWSDSIADDQSEPAIARGVTAMLMDHVLGFALSLDRSDMPPSTTIDLRVDWNRPLVAGAPASIRVDRFVGEGDVVLAQGSMWQGDGETPCACGQARFLSGALPGRRSADSDAVAEMAEASAAVPVEAPSFSRFLGLEMAGSGRFVLPGAPHLLGMAKAGTFHGGFVAAASDRAAEDLLSDWTASGGGRCVTLEIEYIRPAFIAADLLVEARVLRIGRSSASIAIETRQHGWDGPVLTSATALWVKEQVPP